jgi:hypothetical protein
MFTWLCKHSWGPVQDNGFQYCSRCGIALRVSCDHTWKIISEDESLTYGAMVVARIFVLQCSHCGDLKTHRAKVRT